MNFRGIHHAGLVVRDLDAAVAFYGALLEMEIIGRTGGEPPTLAPTVQWGWSGPRPTVR